MVVILVLLTFIGAISINALVVRRLALKKANKMVAEHQLRTMGPSLETPQDTLFHEGHTWVQIQRAILKLGMDDFTQRIIGPVERIETPDVGARVKKGERIWLIKFGERTLEQKAPVSGLVYEVNRDIVQNPKLANESPYHEGWILKMLPDSVTTDLPDLLSPTRFLRWFDLQKAQLFHAETPLLGATYADGGALDEGAARKVDDETWKLISEKLFGTTPRN